MRRKFLAHEIMLLAAFLVLSIVPDNLFAAEKAVHVLVIANTAEEPYKQAIEGFEEQLSLQLQARFTELILSLAINKSASVLAAIKDNNPDLIYTVGAESAELAMQSTLNIPIVSTLILNKNLFSGAKNITGVTLTYPLAIQLQWLKKFFPGQRKVAILYNPAENDKMIEDLRISAEQVGLDLVSIPVSTPKQLPYALEQLASNVEILLAIPDEIVMSPKTAKEVLLASFRNRVPLIGISDNWVKSGALYALSWDYEDLGKQSAFQAGKILKGSSIQNVVPEYPRKLTYTINMKIAEHMNVEISETLLKNAKMIFN
ncbi:MAG: ABC transporter substrate-binding protein [Methylobacter sp.]|nr:ABC transporter substrate-binding protein [Methylobacter sp.]